MAVPTETELRKIGTTVAEAVHRAWKLMGRKEPLLTAPDCLMYNESGHSAIHRHPNGVAEATFVAYTNPGGNGCNVFYTWPLHEPLPMTPNEIGVFLAGALAGAEDQRRLEREQAAAGRRYSLRLVETGQNREETMDGRTFTVKDMENAWVVYLPKQVAHSPGSVDSSVHAWVQLAEQAGKYVLFAVEGENYTVEAIELPPELKGEN